MIDKTQVANIFPLTPLQEGMLFRELASGGGAYVMQTRLRVDGDLDPEDFRLAWERLAERHEVLRLLISPDGAERPLQVTLKRIDIPMPFVDLCAQPEPARNAEIESYCSMDRDKGFNLKHPPLFRLGLFRIAPSRHILILTFHHIIMDGWCQGILHEELLECYQAIRNHRRPALPAVQPFSRYVRYLAERDTATGLSFWQSTLECYEPGGETSWMKRQPAADRPFDLRILPCTLPEPVAQRLRKLAAEQGTTINAAFQALWGALICRLSGNRDAVWGTVVSGRPAELAGSDRTIGLFINTIPVRFRMDSNLTFANAIKMTGRLFAASIAHQHLPLADIQQTCGARNGLFDHLVIFENYPVSIRNDEPANILNITPESSLAGHTEYDLVCVVDDAGSLDCQLKYNAASVDDNTVILLRDALIRFAEQCIARPDKPMSSMTALPDDVITRLTRQLPEGSPLTGDPTTFTALFSEQVHKTPDRPAVETTQCKLSYRELDCASNLIANQLINKCGITRGDRVALITGRDRTLIPAIIGIMKASAVFVPLDPGCPDERIRFILDDCQCHAILAGGTAIERLKKIESARPVIDIGKTMDDQPACTVPKPRQDPAPGYVAYIIYTSGSTGTPKGVMVEHRALANFIRGYIESVLDRHTDTLRIAFVANYIFDAAGRAFYPSLCRGDTVVVVDERTRLDGHELMRLLAMRNIDILDGTPSLCSLAIEGGTVCETVHRVVMGGEALTRSVTDRVRAAFPRAALTNVYGPTETTIDSSFYHVPADDGLAAEIAPLGRPLPNQRLYVVDQDLNALPVGATGEILIGGAGVARGYLGRAELTREKFVPDPFRPGETAYRTGDRGRWRNDGNLLYIGRNDAQVKVRGYRIETGEIMAVVAREPEIEQCAVIVKTDSDNQNSLYVYYAGSIDPRELRARMKRSLPSHMVPDIAIALDRLPLTTTGKIDIMALAAIEPAEPVRKKPGKRPVSTGLQLVIDAMHKVLGRNDIDPDDNFFESGGHSLLAARLISVIASKSGKRLPIAALYRFPTPGELAVFLDRFDPALSGLMETFQFHFNEQGTPLFCFPPYGATGIIYQRLSQALSGYRLECFNYLHSVDFASEATRSILEPARIAPVILLGYSGGGNLAFETARRIEAQGGTIKRIIMLDSYRRLEAVSIPRYRHEQELRSILSSEAYAPFFADSAQLERTIYNGIAYVDYLYSGVEQGMINAPITVIGAGEFTHELSRDRFGALRSRAAWAELTKDEFEFIAGHGDHNEMLDDTNSGLNGTIIRNRIESCQ